MRPRRHASLLLALILSTGWLASCGSDDGGAVSSDGRTTTTEADMSDQTTGTGPGGAQAAVADLAAELDVDPSAITVVSVEAVTWSDSSLGCPREGFMYQQVLTDGTRIILEADGRTYHYHSGATGDPFRCADPREPYSIG